MHARMGALLVVSIIATGVWYNVFTFGESRTLDVYVLNVGQGDALYVRAPSGRDMLIDTGSNDKVIQELESVMPSFDRALDVLILTHSDADHVGGSTALLSRYNVGMIIEGGETASSSAYEQYRKKAIGQKVPRTIVTTGDRLHLDDDVDLDVLLPKPQNNHTKLMAVKNNDSAIVAKLSFGNGSILLTSDMERAGEVALATSDATLESSVLKVGHHGSKYSSWKLFLDRVKPQISAISVGVNNYGHPTEATLERLKDEGSAVFRTDTGGRIHLRSTGGAFAVVEG